MTEIAAFEKRLTPIRSVLLAVLAVGMIPVIGLSKELALEDAYNLAIRNSSRGRIIEGDLEVARQQYQAKRINFLLPRVSLNGSLPAYSVNESFRFFGGASQKSLYKTTDFDFRSNIQLDQSLITGGDLTVTANLSRSDSKYPNTAITGQVINEEARQGFFDFKFVQPLLKPSQAKYDLKNRKDDMNIAELTRREEHTALKKEVTEAYLGVLKTSLQQEISDDKLKSARLKAEVDSVKLVDGVISQDDWYASSAQFLDVELERFDIINEADESNRKLAALLDLGSEESIAATLPAVPALLQDDALNAITKRWEESVPLRKAEIQFEKEIRAAEFATGSHGLTGNLTADYSLGRGEVRTENQSDDDLKTNSWGLAINVTFPIWDGGASGAAVQASHLAAEKSRLIYEGKLKATRAQLTNLINRIDVGYRKLGVLDKQIELAERKLDIAKLRFDDGQVSEILYMESRVFYFEAQIKYIDELQKYLIDRIELKGHFLG